MTGNNLHSGTLVLFAVRKKYLKLSNIEDDREILQKLGLWLYILKLLQLLNSKRCLSLIKLLKDDNSLLFSIMTWHCHLLICLWNRAQWDFKNCLEELAHMFFNVKLNLKVGFFWIFFYSSTPWGRKMHFCKCMGISMGKWSK